MEEGNKSIEEKTQVGKNLPSNPSVRHKFFETCQCPDYLKKEFPHCNRRMKDGLCMDKLIERSYGEDEE